MEYGLGINLEPQANRFSQIRLGDSGGESLQYDANRKCSRVAPAREGWQGETPAVSSHLHANSEVPPPLAVAAAALSVPFPLEASSSPTAR